MAICRVLFAAEHSYTVRTDLIQKSGYALLKSRRLRQSTVQNMPFIVVEFFAFGPAPDNVSQEEVLDSLRLKRALESTFVEMGGVACVWTRPDVNNRIYLVLPQQVKEFFDRVVRVSDRKCCQFRHE